MEKEEGTVNKAHTTYQAEQCEFMFCTLSAPGTSNIDDFLRRSSSKLTFYSRVCCNKAAQLGTR